MKATTILNKLILDVTPDMHQVRRKSLNAMITSLLSGSALTVTSLGRNISSNTTEKHQIKRSARLCSNHHLHQALPSLYQHVATRLVGQQKHPVILVDWSDLDPRKQHFLLRAAIAIEGRSLTLLEEIHPLSKKEKPAVHKAFMQQLKMILPITCQPIIVTDAGFRVPWFTLVLSLGWDFVGRVRNRTFCQHKADKDWYPVKDLYADANQKERYLGHYQLCRRHPIDCQMVVYRHKKLGRKDYVATGEGARKSSHSRANAARENEPWLLATSLTKSSQTYARKVVKIYRSRMQIEESFRDVKTGLQFNRCQSRKRLHLAVLLLVAAIAQLVLFLLGLAVTLLGKQRRYQANSIKKQRILSYQFIGLRAFHDRHLKLRWRDWEAGFTQLQLLAASHYVQ